MRITKVSVKKLFGIFDHEIPLKDSRITIIHGPNGFGKTMLLTMIHGLFNSNYVVFSDMPFEEFRVDFDNEESIKVKKENTSSHSALESASGMESDQDNSKLSIVYSTYEYSPYRLKSPEEYRRRFNDEVDTISDLMRLDSDIWFDGNSILTMEEIIKAYSLQSKLYGEEPEWFAHIRKKIQTRFIQAQRLQSHQTNPDSFRFSFLTRRKVSSIPVSAVEKYSNEIARTIQEASAKYGELSQAKDRSFPMRLIESGHSHQFDQDELQAKLKELESKSSKLMRLGLLDKGEDAPDIPNLGSAPENLNNALAIYVQDIEEKLAVFDEISEQLRILTDIINERFKFKTLKVNKSDGFIFIARDESRIPIANLSSGEQHELVLFYQLLFHVQPNSLILIDEPELSLHVTWQRNFLNDIQRITELRKFDVLIATHSPQIVDDKGDWMVGLQNPENELSDDVVEYA